MRRFTFSRNRTITLRRGQSIALFCGIALVTRRIRLRPGEFVTVTCDASPRTIIVACHSFVTRRRIHLRLGERLIITCS